MQKQFAVNMFDNCIDEKFRKEIWNYTQNIPWHVTWKAIQSKHKHYDYIPDKVTQWERMNQDWIPSMYMPRTGFGSDNATLERDHPLVHELWAQISNILGNEFEIAGIPEGLPMDVIGKWKSPTPIDTSLEPGWRIYGNSQPSENIKRSHGVHRDSILLDDNSYFTLLYVANLEWYPTWFGECVYYPNDIDELTGDTQQYQQGYGQSREFPVGWLDEGRVVSPRPGRIILYDSRNLHTTRPSAIWAKEDRKVIAFRLRRKHV